MLKLAEFLPTKKQVKPTDLVEAIYYRYESAVKCRLFVGLQMSMYYAREIEKV